MTLDIGSPPRALRAPRHPVLTTAACCAGVVMSLQETTAAMATVRAIQDDLHVPTGALSWIAGLYTLVVAVLVLTGGTLAERYGRRRMYLVGTVLFGCGSLIAATAGTYAHLLAGRVVSGVGGALVLPTSLAILSLSTDDPARRMRRVSVWVTSSGIALACGPILGGLLVERYGWHAAYLVNLPLSLVTVALTLAGVAESRTPGRTLDLPGQACAIVGLGLTVYAITRAGHSGYDDPVTLAALGAGLLGVLALVLVERRAADPMLRVRPMGRLPHLAGLILAACAMLGFVGACYLQTLYFQSARGMSPLAAAVHLPALVVPFLVTNTVCGRLLARFAPLRVAAVGFLFSAVGAGVLAAFQDSGASTATVVAGMALLGTALGLTVTPATTAAIMAVDAHDGAAASNSATAFRQLGSVLGTSVLGSVFASHLTAGLPGALARTGLPASLVDTVARAVRDGGASSGTRPPPRVLDAVAGALSEAVSAAYVTATAILLCAACLAAYTSRHPTRTTSKGKHTRERHPLSGHAFRRRRTRGPAGGGRHR
ncbi:MFS transporter [Streptomyces sp. NPDC052040]|uniref:MFS transporter n=1 Tax=unclassified Streptomyces TaxID=2593676 RepID=UPI0037CFE7D1